MVDVDSFRDFARHRRRRLRSRTHSPGATCFGGHGAANLSSPFARALLGRPGLRLATPTPAAEDESSSGRVGVFERACQRLSGLRTR